MELLQLAVDTEPESLMMELLDPDIVSIILDCSHWPSSRDLQSVVRCHTQLSRIAKYGAQIHIIYLLMNSYELTFA